MRSRTATPRPALRHQTAAYLTSKPSLRRHALCASICAAQASSPNITTHSSRGLRVSAARRGGARRGGAVQARWTESRRAASGTSRRSRRRSSSAAAPNARLRTWARAANLLAALADGRGRGRGRAGRRRRRRRGICCRRTHPAGAKCVAEGCVPTTPRKAREKMRGGKARCFRSPVQCTRKTNRSEVGAAAR